jgi:hypothetical protein
MLSPAVTRRARLAVAFALAVLAAGAPSPARAVGDLIVRDLGQGGLFRDLTTELGIGLSSFQVAPAAPLGFPRFDVGVEVTTVNINQDRLYWRLAFGDQNPPSVLPLPKLHATVGLPLGIDVGGIYSQVPGSNIRLWGAEVKWAVIRGGLVSPALAVRGAYTSLDGVDELDLTTRSVDASISKGLGPVTPYVGGGRVWIEAEPRGAAANPLLGLREVNPVADRVFAGLRLRLALLSAVAEASFSRVPAYTLRLNISF